MARSSAVRYVWVAVEVVGTAAHRNNIYDRTVIIFKTDLSQPV